LDILAEVFSSQGRQNEAESMCQRALEIREKVLRPEKALGAHHPDMARYADSYAHLLQKLGRGFEAHKTRARFKR
jgi:kinesin light chain